MSRRGVKSIMDELCNIVFGFYCGETDQLAKMTPFEQQEVFLETVSFLFPDYEKDFDHNTIERFKMDQDSFLEMERKMFLLWCAQQVVERIKKHQEERLELLKQIE